jgi:hypothetical protein
MEVAVPAQSYMSSNDHNRTHSPFTQAGSGSVWKFLIVGPVGSVENVRVKYQQTTFGPPIQHQMQVLPNSNTAQYAYPQFTSAFQNPDPLNYSQISTQAPTWRPVNYQPQWQHQPLQTQAPQTGFRPINSTQTYQSLATFQGPDQWNQVADSNLGQPNQGISQQDVAQYFESYNQPQMSQQSQQFREATSQSLPDHLAQQQSFPQQRHIPEGQRSSASHPTHVVSQPLPSSSQITSVSQQQTISQGNDTGRFRGELYKNLISHDTFTQTRASNPSSKPISNSTISQSPQRSTVDLPETQSSRSPIAATAYNPVTEINSIPRPKSSSPEETLPNVFAGRPTKVGTSNHPPVPSQRSPQKATKAISKSIPSKTRLVPAFWTPQRIITLVAVLRRLRGVPLSVQEQSTLEVVIHINSTSAYIADALFRRKVINLSQISTLRERLDIVIRAPSEGLAQLDIPRMRNLVDQDSLNLRELVIKAMQKYALDINRPHLTPVIEHWGNNLKEMPLHNLEQTLVDLGKFSQNDIFLIRERYVAEAIKLGNTLQVDLNTSISNVTKTKQTATIQTSTQNTPTTGSASKPSFATINGTASTTLSNTNSTSPNGVQGNSTPIPQVQETSSQRKFQLMTIAQRLPTTTNPAGLKAVIASWPTSQIARNILIAAGRLVPNDDRPLPNVDLLPLKAAFLDLKVAELSTLEWDVLDQPPQVQPLQNGIKEIIPPRDSQNSLNSTFVGVKSTPANDNGTKSSSSNISIPGKNLGEPIRLSSVDTQLRQATLSTPRPEFKAQPDMTPTFSATASAANNAVTKSPLGKSMFRRAPITDGTNTPTPPRRGRPTTKVDKVTTPKVKTPIYDVGTPNGSERGITRKVTPLVVVATPAGPVTPSAAIVTDSDDLMEIFIPPQASPTATRGRGRGRGSSRGQGSLRGRGTGRGRGRSRKEPVSTTTHATATTQNQTSRIQSETPKKWDVITKRKSPKVAPVLAVKRPRGRPRKDPQASSSTSRVTPPAAIVDLTDDQPTMSPIAAIPLPATDSSDDESVDTSDRSDDDEQKLLDGGYKSYLCQWQGCSAELHSFDTLEKHVHKVHGKPDRKTQVSLP